MTATIRKPRADSKLDHIPAERIAELRDGLLGGWNYAEAIEWLKSECGVSSGMDALSRFYQRHCAPLLLQRRQLAAIKAEMIGAQAGKTDWDAASVETLRQLAFELLASPQADPKEVERMFSLVLRRKEQEIGERKVAMLERKARKLDEIEAKAREMKAGGGLSDETLEMLEKQLKIL